MSEVHQIGPRGPAKHCLEVKTLEVIAETVIVGKPPKDVPADELKRFYLNSFLLAVLFLTITVWFTAHLKTYMTGSILLGTATLWSIFQIVVAGLTKPWEKETDDWRKRFLFGHETRWHLCFFIALSIMLCAATSSVHVKLGDGAEKSVEIRVREKRSGLSAVPTIHLGGDVKIHGAPMFSAFQTRHVVLHVEQPGGYHPKEADIYAGEAAYLIFPKDFEKQTLVRIYVPIDLSVPGVGADKHDKTDLVITADGRSVTESKYSGRAVYVGLTDLATSKTLIQKGRTAFEAARREELDALVAAQDVADFLDELRRDPIIRTDWNLNRKHTVTAIITIAGEKAMHCSAAVEENRINDCVMKEI